MYEISQDLSPLQLWLIITITWFYIQPRNKNKSLEQEIKAERVTPAQSRWNGDNNTININAYFQRNNNNNLRAPNIIIPVRSIRWLSKGSSQSRRHGPNWADTSKFIPKTNYPAKTMLKSQFNPAGCRWRVETGRQLAFGTSSLPRGNEQLGCLFFVAAALKAVTRNERLTSAPIALLRAAGDAGRHSRAFRRRRWTGLTMTDYDSGPTPITKVHIAHLL
jgi:hypothetical protein